MSYVALATYQCPVCLEFHSHNAEILLHKRLKDIPEGSTFVGSKFCEEHQNLFDQGYVFLIVAEEPEGDTLKPEDAIRTGDVIALKESVAKQLFNGFRHNAGLVFICPETYALLCKWKEETYDLYPQD